MSDTTSPRVRLISFGAPRSFYKYALERLEQQATDFLMIDDFRMYDETALPPDYLGGFGNLSSASEKGFGFWSWKPWIIHRELTLMRKGDILVYLDAGCELNTRGLRKFSAYLDWTSQNDLCLFSTELPQRFWTKRDASLNQRDHFFRNQIVGNALLAKVGDRSLQFAQLWLDLASEDNHRLLRDPEINDLDQNKYFIDHRHDQSVLSETAYRLNIPIFPTDETSPDSMKEKILYPILALRNKSGVSYLPIALSGPILGFIRKILLYILDPSHRARFMKIIKDQISNPWGLK